MCIAPEKNPTYCNSSEITVWKGCRRSGVLLPSEREVDQIASAVSIFPEPMMARPYSFLLIGALLLSLGLLACGETRPASDVLISNEQGPTPSPQEARAALNEALEAFNDHCILPGEQGAQITFPFSLVNPDTRNRTFQYTQLQALVDVGLLDTTHVEARGGLPVVRYEVTAKGKTAQYEVIQGRSRRTAFCYAVPQVARIDSIKSKYTSGPIPLANVWFSYHYERRGQWVETDTIQKTFANLRSVPQPNNPKTDKKLLIRVDTTWVDQRLAGSMTNRHQPTRNSE